MKKNFFACYPVGNFILSAQSIFLELDEMPDSTEGQPVKSFRLTFLMPNVFTHRRGAVEISRMKES